MIGSPSEADRFIGFSGYDWATYKNDPDGVTIGLNSRLRFFDQPPMPGSTASILARLDLVEGLSGSAHNDYTCPGMILTPASWPPPAPRGAFGRTST